MRPGDDTTELARQMLARQRQGQEGPGGERPFILFLGQECADAAGVPSLATIARQVLSDPELRRKYLAEADPEDPAALQEAFEDLLEDMSTGQRYRMLQSYFSGVPVPTFYQDLALLVRAGYFDHLLTTNIDNLLEQALVGAGMAPDRDFEVVVLGKTEELPWQGHVESSGKAHLRIIKLHGDLAQQRVAITRDEISDALRPQRTFIKGEITGDMIMVGYQLESESLNEWLSWVPGTVWWIGPDPEDEAALRSIESRREVIRIEGEGARPEVIFGQLAWLLLRTPAPAVKGAEQAAYRSFPEEELTAAGLPGAEYSDAAFIETQLRRSRSILQALEASAMPGEKNPALEAQIEYERDQIAELEARLRSLEPVRERLLTLMDNLRLSVQRAARKDLVDKHAAAYLRRQISTVQDEYQREVPNQSIVAAAVGATVVLADSLGEGVIDPKVVQQLSAYAPSTIGWRS